METKHKDTNITLTTLSKDGMTDLILDELSQLQEFGEKK
jgi:hypothetical protein